METFDILDAALLIGACMLFAGALMAYVATDLQLLRRAGWLALCASAGALMLTACCGALFMEHRQRGLVVALCISLALGGVLAYLAKRSFRIAVMIGE